MTNGWPAGWVVTDRTKKEIVTFRSVLYWTVEYLCCAHNLCEYVLGLGLCVYISRVSGRLATGGCGICLCRRQQRARYPMPCVCSSCVSMWRQHPRTVYCSVSVSSARTVSYWKYSSILNNNSARRTKILSDVLVFVATGNFLHITIRMSCVAARRDGDACCC